MNERIKKLISECTYTVTDYSMGIDNSVEEFDKEKFAELIVLECMDVLDGKIYESIDHEGNETWPDLILKEHFGVEE